MEIRFASIPKTASRSLKTLRLLGEMQRPHCKVRDYPEWEKYKWYAVRRPTHQWLASWWYEAKKARAPITEALGMKFENMVKDLAILGNPPEIPPMKNVRFHAWIPENFSEAYKPFHGRFHDFCYAQILDGVPCETIDLKDLNEWLCKRGYGAAHENRTGG